MQTGAGRQNHRSHRDFTNRCFSSRVQRLKRLFIGGSAGNEQLTAAVAAVLIALLAVEGATILRIQSLLNVHAFVGMLLIPVIGLKLASTGWRMVRYYRRGEEYVLRGPPHVALRVLVAPLVIVSTIFVFGTGVALLAVDQTQGTLVGLHKASFVVWLGATGIHVLAHLVELGPALRRRLPGVGLRYVLLGLSLVAGAVLAMGTLPAADRLKDHATRFAGFDRH
jgi:hypothetical protein